MIIVYYEDVQTHKITNVEKIPEKYSEREVLESLCKFNQTHEDKSNATIIKVEDESASADCFMWLLDELKRKRSIAKELIEDAIRALDEAKDAICELEEWK